MALTLLSLYLASIAGSGLFFLINNALGDITNSESDFDILLCFIPFVNTFYTVALPMLFGSHMKNKREKRLAIPAETPLLHNVLDIRLSDHKSATTAVTRI